MTLPSKCAWYMKWQWEEQMNKSTSSALKLGVPKVKSSNNIKVIQDIR